MKSFQTFLFIVALVVSVSYIGTVDSDNRVATLAAVSTGGSLNTTPSGSGSLQTNIPLGNLNTKLTDSCKTPGVGCAFRSGNIYPDGDCNPVKTAAALNGCKKQYGIARLQVTSGVGVPAPSIVGIKYTSTKCTVTVRLRKTGPVITGPCKTDANKTCPTAHANDKTACFWQGCPGTCLKPSKAESPKDQGTGKDGAKVTNDSNEPSNQSSGKIQDGGIFAEQEKQNAQGYIDRVKQGNLLTATERQKLDQYLRKGGVVTGASYVISEGTGDTSLVFSDGSRYNLTSGSASGPLASVGTVTNQGGGVQSTTGGVGNTNVPVQTGGQNIPQGNQGTVNTQVGQNNPVAGNTNTGSFPQTTGAGTNIGNNTNVGGNYQSGGVNTGGYNNAQTSYGSTYRSLQNPQSLQRPQSFIQQFAGYVTGQQPYIGSQADLRNSPQGQVGGQPQIIYVTPNYDAEAIANVARSGRTVQEIASDISALTPANFARVDHFAQTLESVGGPSENSIENKSFGRIQDLIVEDEAIRALRVAEEEGRRAKNTVYCRANETAESCDARREAKAKEVERDVFVAELEKRVLPDSAIEHFLAVYDGWVRPSPAPQTHATSTLGLLNTQNDGIADYELVTSGSNFVLWFIDSVADATVDAVNAVIGLFQ